MRTWQRSPRFLFLWTDDAPDAGFPQAGGKRWRTVSLPENEGKQRWSPGTGYPNLAS
jgi:hypothetical protein